MSFSPDWLDRFVGEEMADRIRREELNDKETASELARLRSEVTRLTRERDMMDLILNAIWNEAAIERARGTAYQDFARRVMELAEPHW